MSWHFSQALVAGYLAENSSDGKPSALLNTTAMPPLYSSSDKMTDFCRRSRYGMTCGPLTDTLGGELLTWFLAGFPVRISAPRGMAEGSKTENALASGWKWPGSSVKYDPASASWKTRQCSLLGDSESFWETWPRWGTMRNGECWERQTWERRTNETGSGLLPTPLATLGTNGGPNQRDSSGRPGLQMAAMMWPTPKASAAGPDFAKMDRSGTGISLATAVAMFPTPTATNTKAVHMRGADKGKARQARSYLPTPTVCGNYNRKGASPTSGDGLATVVGGQLNPMWVEWLMGWPLGWTDLNALEMDRCHNAPLRHSEGF